MKLERYRTHIGSRRSYSSIFQTRALLEDWEVGQVLSYIRFVTLEVRLCMEVSSEESKSIIKHKDLPVIDQAWLSKPRSMQYVLFASSHLLRTYVDEDTSLDTSPSYEISKIAILGLQAPVRS